MFQEEIGPVRCFFDGPGDDGVESELPGPGSALPGVRELFQRDDFEYFAIDISVESESGEGSGGEPELVADGRLEIVWHEPFCEQFGFR